MNRLLDAFGVGLFVGMVLGLAWLALSAVAQSRGLFAACVVGALMVRVLVRLERGTLWKND